LAKFPGAIAFLVELVNDVAREEPYSEVDPGGQQGHI